MCCLSDHREPAMSTDQSAPAEARTDVPRNRRTALQILTGCIGLLLNLVPVTLGGLFFLDPLFRRKPAGPVKGLEGSTKLGVNTEAIPADGTPIAVTVIADLTDAWNKYKNVPIGSIWLRRKSDGSLAAFNSTCPHLGCFVDYRPGDNEFYCPCHTSAFDLDGQKKNDVPPRVMDSLEVYRATDGERDDNGTELWVRYQEFRGGTAEKIEV